MSGAPRRPEDSSISLYIHIPYCASKCDYCDFFSRPSRSGVPDEYVDALKAEMIFAASESGAKEWRTVYIGGGTPSLMTEAQTASLLEAADRAARIKGGAEVTLEMNPAGVTRKKLSAIARSGVTRVSCGAQSLRQESLDAVRRESSKSAALDACALLASSWNGTFSVDMMAGLPFETMESFSRGLEKILSFSPHHVSLYPLSVAEGTPLFARAAAGEIALDKNLADEMWISGRDFLVSRGYRQYEASNFCAGANVCEHNMAYWRMKSYSGCGAGAVGSLYSKGGSVRLSNSADADAYISFWTGARLDISKIPRSVEALDKKTEEFEFFMMGLRTDEGICEERHLERFGEKIDERTMAEFDRWERKGLCEKTSGADGTRRRMSARGLLFLDEFLRAIAP